MTPSAAEEYYGIKPGATIDFVVPVGFRGEIQITEDKDSGIPLTPKGGTLVLHIPDNGRLIVRSLDPFKREHRETAHYSNGEEIPNPLNSVKEFSPRQVGFYGGGILEGSRFKQPTLLYLVGTKEELEKVK